MIISVGFRVKSIVGTKFRRWATGVLKEHLLRGYSVNQQFLAIHAFVRYYLLLCVMMGQNIVNSAEK